MNGRYESKDILLELLDHAKSIGAFEQIVVVEEPFPEAVRGRRKRRGRTGGG